VGGWEPALLRALVELQILYREPPPAYEWTALQKTHTAQGIHIDSDTAATLWRGERMDYELGVWVLCSEEERAGRARGPRASDARVGDWRASDGDFGDSDSPDGDSCDFGFGDGDSRDVSAETFSW
jgi:hypothetical protein